MTPGANRLTLDKMRRRHVTVTVNDKMQRGYRYVLTEPAGRNFDPEFDPELTPKEMLALGVFGGKYMTDCRNEFPSNWFVRAKLSSTGYDSTLNYFRVRREPAIIGLAGERLDSSG